MRSVPAGHRWSQESVRELLRAVAPTGSRQLTESQREQLRGMVERRWQDRAGCAGSTDPVAWYPTEGCAPDRDAIRICAACPVRRSCLAVALLWDEDGIWAGTSPGRRRDGYRLLRAGVSMQTAVHLLLAEPARKSVTDADDLVSPESGESQRSCEAA
ncbi:MAG TPA: WhiB family transcriptional regulator [Actinomycetales bacterium]|nr:WhiB family transcriptional regulator [Actinomycetales bacterium]